MNDLTRVLVLGSAGQLGRELMRAPHPAGCAIVGLTRADGDLARPAMIEAALAASAAAIVVNAAAYTAVDRAEREPELAMAVNRDGPAALAAACAGRGAALVHISTDYVFDGGKTEAYLETDAIGPLQVYGRSKAQGEAAVRTALDRHVILRASWVFGAHGGNFVKTMLRLAEGRDELPVVADQRGRPTAAADLAAAIWAVVAAIATGRARWGTFHFGGSPVASWYELADAVLALSAPRRGRRPGLRRLATADYPTAAARPANAVLACEALLESYGLATPDWRLGLVKVLTELGA